MRFKKRIDLNEIKSEYQPNTYISFNLPRKKLDLHSLSLYYTGNPAVYSHVAASGAITAFETFTASSRTNILLFANSRMTFYNHNLYTGLKVTYHSNGGNPVAPMVNGTDYWVIKIDDDNIRLATSEANALAGNFLAFTARGTGTAHTLEYATGDFKTINRFFPRLSSSIIQEMTVKIKNDTTQDTVTQYIQEYNMLYAILNDIYKEYDDIDSTSQDTVQEHYIDNSGYIANVSKLQAVPRAQTYVEKYSDANKRKFYIDNFLGFLGQGNRYIDATNMDIQVTIKLAPPNILYRGIQSVPGVANLVTYEPDYRLSDVYATVDVCDEIPMASEFVYKDYQYIQGTYLPDNKRVLTSFQSHKPIEWVLGTFANQDRFVDSELQLMHANTDEAKFGLLMRPNIDITNLNDKVPNELLYSYEVAKFQKDPYLLNSSIYFDRQGKGIRWCRYRNNSYDLTPMQDIIACYNETKKCFSSDYKKVCSVYSFEENFFANAVRLDDTSSELKNIEWEVEINPSATNTSGGTPMLFCCFMNKL